ncbi:MAG: hypothetical protein QXU62_05155 [Thermofilaceae archaeon]
MSSDIDRFLSSEVYDLASSAGTFALNARVEKTQLSNILETFESEPNPLSAIKLTITFIARQIGRGEIQRDVGKRIIRDLASIFDRFKESELRAAARKYLYLVKWFYDSGYRERINDFKDFISKYTGT